MSRRGIFVSSLVLLLLLNTFSLLHEAPIGAASPISHSIHTGLRGNERPGPPTSVAPAGPTSWSPTSGLSSPGIPSYRLTTVSRSVGSCPASSPAAAWLAYDSAVKAFWVAAPPSCVDVFPANSTQPIDSIRVGNDPFGVAVDNATHDVFVSNSGSNNVSVISDQNHSAVASVQVGTKPFGVAYDWATQEIYVANRGSNNVTVISGSTLHVVATVRVGVGPLGVVADPGSGQVFVADSGSNEVSVISDATHIVLATVAAGSGPYGVALANGSDRIFVANEGSTNITVIDASTDSRIATIALLAPFMDLQGVAYDAQTGLVWVGAGSRYAAVVNATSFAVVGYATTDPSGVAYDPDNGEICVTNSANYTFICIAFFVHTITAPLTFSETGLPAGTVWTASVNQTGSNRTTQSTTSTNVTFWVDRSTLTQGSYWFVIGPIDGYVATPSRGPVTWSYGVFPPVLNVTFRPAPGTFSVLFQETGLPTGTTWAVVLNGTVDRSNSSTHAFREPNGVHGFTVLAVPGYFATPSSGSALVNGAPVSINLAWSPILHEVSFIESGLPVGTAWSVALGGTIQTSSTAIIAFTPGMGTYSYVVVGVPGYATGTWSGSVRVSNGNVSLPIPWTRVTYPAWFNETGLPNATAWGVSLVVDGQYANWTVSTATTSAQLANGSYPFVISAPSNYEVFPSSGVLAVSGGVVTLPITIALRGGYLVGTIVPSAAVLWVGATRATLIDGVFNVSETPGTYSVEVTVGGQHPYFTNVTILAGHTTWLNVSLAPPSSSGPHVLLLPSLPFIALAGVLVVVLVAAGVLLARRRRSRPPPDAESGTGR